MANKIDSVLHIELKTPYRYMRNYINVSLTLIALFAFSPALLSAQKGNKKNQTSSMGSRELFVQGSQLASEGFVDSALSTFLILYRRDTNNANVCYNIGELYLLTPAYKASALPYLVKAGQKVTSRYHPGDPYEKSAPPPAYYYLARAQHLNYQFDNSIDNFNKFKKLLSKGDPRLDTIDYWIQCCNNGKDLMKTPVDCKVINIGDSINSAYPDYSPILSADEQTLMFTSRRPALGDSTRDIQGNYYEDIWISYAKPTGGWTSALNIGPPVNSAGNDATVSLSPDGQTMILYKDDNMGNGSINVSYLRGTKWTRPIFIDSSNSGVVNATGWQPSACLTPDGQTLYFVSNRAGGLGGSDIYKVALQDNGKWGAPVNLGPNINTKYDEDAPFIHADDSTMFFSSKGHNTMGGFDVFSAKLDNQGNWGNVHNLGYPVNTPDDDIYFSLSADGKRAYYSSVRPGGYGEKDIYEVLFNTPVPVEPVAILVGYIKTPDGTPLPSDLLVSTNRVNDTNTYKVKVNRRTGKFLQVLKPNQTYHVAISTGGRNVFDQNFFLPADSSYLNLSRSFFRTSIVLGDTSNVLSPHYIKPYPVAVNKTGNMKGKIALPDTTTPVPPMKIQLMDDKDSVLATTLTDKEGYFTFKKLPTDQSYLLQADASDSKLKRVKKLYLADSNGHLVRDFDERKKDIYTYGNLPVDLSKLPPLAFNDTKLSDKEKAERYKKDTAGMPKSDADFTRYFAYNVDKVNSEDADFTALIDKLVAKAAGGAVTIALKGSASKVPAHKFLGGNKNLAHERAKITRNVIERVLKSKNVDMSKVQFTIDSSVQGPDYEHDASDQVKYEKYQYVKVYIQ